MEKPRTLPEKIPLKVDKALIVGDFNIHVDNTYDALGLNKLITDPLIFLIIR